MLKFWAMFFGLLAAIVIVPVLLYVLFFGANLFVVGPLRHVWNTHKAEATNLATWETGFADVYTVETAFWINGKPRDISMDVVCARKIETGAISIKGGPYVWDSVQDISPPRVVAQVFDDYSIAIDLQLQCYELAKEAVGEGHPFRTSNYENVTAQYTAEPVTTCLSPRYNGAPRGVSTTIGPRSVLSVRKVPLRDVLSIDELAPADRNDLRAWQQKALFMALLSPDDRRFVWSRPDRCRKVLIDGGSAQDGQCAPWADEICTPSL